MKKLAAVAAMLGMVGAYTSGQTVAHAWDAQSSSPPSASPVHYVETAFAATRAHFTGYEVHDWTTLNDAFLSQQAVHRLSHELAMKLHLSQPRLYQHQDSRDHVALWSGTVVVQGLSLQSTVEVASLDIPNAPAQTVVILRVLGGGNAQATLDRVYAAVDGLADAIGGHAQVNATLFGALPGLRTGEERSAAIRRAFAAVGAQELQPMQSPYTTSVAGYAPQATVATAQAGQQTLNLQVALHADGYKSVTRVLVGSPIITVEY